jgi:putative effector of murein hydrolase
MALVDQRYKCYSAVSKGIIALLELLYTKILLQSLREAIAVYIKEKLGKITKIIYLKVNLIGYIYRIVAYIILKFYYNIIFRKP